MNKRFSKIVLLACCLSWSGLLSAGSPGLAFGRLTTGLDQEQLAALLPGNLATYRGLPVLPAYSLGPGLLVNRLNGPNPRPSTAPARVGIQIGHLRSSEMPAEMASLRNSGGASAGGRQEVDITTDVARRVAALLKAHNIEVDVLPATVPPNYSADAFISLHGDWSVKPSASGFKLARGRYSAIPATDDRLLESIYASYEKSTGLAREHNITINMTDYYAFNNLKFKYTLSSSTPAAIIELGFLTNASDGNLLATQPDRVAQGLVDGILEFLQTSRAGPPPEPHKSLPVLKTRAATGDGPPLVEVYTADGRVLAYVAGGQEFAYFEQSGSYWSVWLPVLNRSGLLKVETSEIING